MTPATRTPVSWTIYADMDGWLVKLAQGWRLCGLAPEPRVPFWVLM